MYYFGIQLSTPVLRSASCSPEVKLITPEQLLPRKLESFLLRLVGQRTVLRKNTLVPRAHVSSHVCHVIGSSHTVLVSHIREGYCTATSDSFVSLRLMSLPNGKCVFFCSTRTSNAAVDVDHIWACRSAQFCLILYDSELIASQTFKFPVSGFRSNWVSITVTENSGQNDTCNQIDQ